MPDEQLAELLRELGREWALELRPAGGDERSRLAAASALLNELGGITEVEERDGQFRIRGHSCPLAALVQENPRTCVAIEALLSELVGRQLRECCERTGERPRCCFEASGSG
jgi:predicted ArsR family transcriptional regulator